MAIEEGSAAELVAYAELAAQLPQLYRAQFSDPLVPRTVIVVPSLSFNSDELEKISGVHHYEERMLCMLMLLRLPRTHVFYLTSQAIASSVIDYHLHLLSGIPSNHARRRLHMFDCGDTSPVPLSRKLLDRPRLLARIRGSIPDPSAAHMSVFTSTQLERSLAVQLKVPLYACDPALLPLGTKSGSRKLFRGAGLLLPDGFEDLRDGSDVAKALVALHKRNVGLRRAVVKLNDGFSGEGNALFEYDTDEVTEAWVRQELPKRLRFVADDENWDDFEQKFQEMEGIVECFVEGDDKRSPSVQYRIDPLGRAEPVSTHDQMLGGEDGQIFSGCRFPADENYRQEIQQLGAKVADLARGKGVIGRFAVDFVSVRDGDGWKHYGLEINLRKGGTTHPLMVLHFLTDGRYDAESGLFVTPTGQPRFYYASDNIESKRYRGLLPEDLIDIMVCNGLHFHAATQQGVAFHLISAVSEFGKLGMVCIADSPESAERLRKKTVSVLDEAAAGQQ